MSAQIDKNELESKVKKMYKDVAENPKGDFHFEMGRGLALKLGYPAEVLDKIPSEAIDSFAGVGYHFGLAELKPWDKILDFGSGSGTDVFFSAIKTGEAVKVVGLDMTDEQLQKGEALRQKAGFGNVEFKKGYIEELPFKSENFDAVISNGVINLSAEKEKVFKEIGRVLKKGGKMAISDIVTEIQLTDSIIQNANLWAACIGGAMQQDLYKNAINDASMKVMKLIENSQYGFLTDSAKSASKKYGVKSISLLAQKG